MTKRKSPVVSSVESTRATAYQLRRMSEMVRWIVTGRRGGYRWLAKFTTRSFGYWQHIATKSGRVKPTVSDYNTIRRIHDILRDGAALDTEMVGLLLEVMEHRGKLDAALARLLGLVRRKDSA